MIIQEKTFRASEVDSYGLEEGFVTVSFGGDTKEVRAFRFKGRITAKGFGGKYETGAKMWPATVTLDLSTGQECAEFGRDDRSDRFNKLRGIFLL